MVIRAIRGLRGKWSRLTWPRSRSTRTTSEEGDRPIELRSAVEQPMRYGLVQSHRSVPASSADMRCCGSSGMKIVEVSSGVISALRAHALQ